MTVYDSIAFKSDIKTHTLTTYLTTKQFTGGTTLTLFIRLIVAMGGSVTE
jgi:hypothetical protein